MTETKKQNRLLPAIIILLCYFLTLMVLWYMGRSEYPRKYFYYHDLMYPRTGAEYVGLTGFILLTGIIIAINYFFIRHTKGYKKIAANIVLILLFFLTMEGSLWWFSKNHQTEYKPNPYLLYERIPQGHGIINSMGIKEREIPIKKEDNEFRILLIGDSAAEGSSVQQGNRFSEILERKLSESFPKRKITVINAGMPGYTSFSMVRLFKSRLNKYDPDAIIISVNNDCFNKPVETKERAVPLSMLPLFNVLYKSELYLLMRKVTTTYKLRMLNQQVELSRRRGKDTSKFAVSLDDVRNNYLEMINPVKKNGGSAIILIMPVMQHNKQGGLPPLIKEYHKMKKKVAKETDSLVIDFFREWAPDPQNDKLFTDHLHPNEEGHKKIGERIHEEILKKGLKGLTEGK